VSNTARRSPIDPSSDEVVLEYVEGSRAPRDVPARDLHGGDLARLVYVDALRSRREDPEIEADDVRPEIATAGELRTLAGTLIATGAFTYADPATPAPAETTTPAPADPAVTPEG
jgi:hypothetical protein